MSQSNSGCLGILFAPFFKRREPVAEPLSDDEINAFISAESLPYEKRDDFLSAAEISFFHVLKTVLTTDHYLITKVNLADLFYVKRPHENKGARGRISQKHVDYVVCDAKTMEPLVGIELDDRSHEREDRKKRDAFVDRVFEAAGLPILHVPAAKGYLPNDIRALLQQHFPIGEPSAQMTRTKKY